MAKIIIRPARSGDLAAFYDVVPASMRAVVAEKDGQVIGYGAVAYRGGQLLAISDMKDDMRQHKRAIIATGKAMMEVVKKIGAPVVAFACENEHNSRGFLEHFGFELVDETPMGAMYKWHKQSH